MDNSKLKILIKDAQKVHFDDEADVFSSNNEVGPFDVLVLHENFISIIKQKITIINSKSVVKEIEFDSAILKALDNKLYVFLGIETLNTLDTNQIPGANSNSEVKQTPKQL